jgi:hypothetical protein
MRNIKRRLRAIAPDFLVSVRQHSIEHGRFPRLLNPQTFSEKVLYRKLFDRRGMLTQFADKYAVREYVEGKLGPEILPALYHVTRKPEDIPFDALPDRFAVKPTHGSGWVRLVRDKAALDQESLIAACRGWLRTSFYRITREWSYKHIEPRIIVEELIDDGAGDVPRDYKCYVFHGKVAMIQLDEGRFGDHRRNLYSPAWEKLEARLNRPNIEREVPAPKHLAAMIRAAEALGSEIDFVRADFYDTGDRLLFGELTTTLGGGLEPFSPVNLDLRLGALWNFKQSRGADAQPAERGPLSEHGFLGEALAGFVSRAEQGSPSPALLSPPLLR